MRTAIRVCPASTRFRFAFLAIIFSIAVTIPVAASVPITIATAAKTPAPTQAKLR
jgi:hypothetical protein